MSDATITPVFDENGECIARIECDGDVFEPYLVWLIGSDAPPERFPSLLRAKRFAESKVQVRWAKDRGPEKPPPLAELDEPEGAAQKPTTTEAHTDSTTPVSGGMDTMLFADGFEDAFVGVGTQFNTFVAVYDLEKAKLVLERKGMTENEALEYLDYNVLGADVGKQTPIFVERLSMAEARDRASEW